jgi:L-ascorbate metabolism protein UlaG (beta-lactamase superfamily)
MNLEHPYITSFWEVLKWKLQKNPFQQEKQIPYTPHISNDISWLENNRNCIVWLGHCTFYIRLQQTVFLTDPVFGSIPLFKRRSPLPLDPNQLKGIHYLLLSHDHRDHCDKPSIKTVTANNPQMQVLCGLGLDGLLKKWHPNMPVQTAGWYQQYKTSEKELAVFFVPERHWAKRGLGGTNKHLWGGFMIRNGHTCIYFGGDSGYNGHYQQTAQVLGKPDYALLGIGAYEPQWFMHTFHQSPANAVQAFKDLRATHLIPMHYGTFDLADEPLSYPLQYLQQAAAAGGLANALLTPAIGQAIYL